MASGRVIIVTGASRGIGLAAAHYLLKQHYKIVAIARSEDPLRKLAQEYPDQVQILAGDLADFKLGQKAVDIAESTWSRIDGLIINHGILNPVKRISDTDAQEWRDAFDVNVFSAIAMIKAALPSVRSSKGKIILVSSGAAVSAYSTWGAYGASKAVLNHIALTLAVEEPDIITVSIRPGTVDTEMQRELREVHHKVMDTKDAEKFAGLKGNGKLLSPEQPGNVIAKLAIDAPKALTGCFLNWNDKDLEEFQ